MSCYSLTKCPYCFKENVAGTVANYQFHPNSKDFNIFGYCNNCHGGVVSTGHISGGHDHLSFKIYLENYSGDLSNIPSSQLRISEWLPKPPVPEIPDHLPDNIAAKFNQAELLYNQNGMEDPSGNAYRSTLERALKHIAPEATGSLNNRIEKLINSRQIVSSMGDFAHSIRTLGNSATHDDEDMSREELTDLRTFTELFLKYMFTLPAMIPDKVKKS